MARFSHVPFWCLLLGASAQSCGQARTLGPEERSASADEAAGRNSSELEGRGECETADDCRLEQDRCCADCKSPELYEAVSQDEHQRHVEECALSKCGPPDYRPGELECSERYDALAAVCVSGTCTKLDLLESRFTACERDDECQLRTGAYGCCPLCSVRAPTINGVQYYMGGLVAFSDLEGFLSAYCPGTPACSECPSSIPNEVSARCLEGHCRVIYDGSPITFPSP
jgi:hypothetical protein